MGPMIRMSLPSFSGRTIHNPHLLQYACHIECRLRVVEAAKISSLDTAACFDNHKEKDRNSDLNVSAGDEACSGSISVLLSKPILALEFNSLKMQVEAPVIVNNRPRPNRKQVGDLRTY